MPTRFSPVAFAHMVRAADRFRLRSTSPLVSLQLVQPHVILLHHNSIEWQLCP